MNELLLVLTAIGIVESGQHNHPINVQDGNSASYGLHQIKLSTARQFGYKGHVTTLWLNQEVNRKYALLYLEYQYKRYNNSLDCAIVAYNRGSVRNRELVKQSSYLKKVREVYAKISRKNDKRTMY
jgi:soluble lytic murein transglycosylase-like protein